MKFKVLMIVPSNNRMGDTGSPTGVWVEELAVPYYALVDSDVEVTLASPAGGPMPLDPGSLEVKGESGQIVERFLSDDELQSRIASTFEAANLDGAQFDAVFFPGGQGAMWDLPDDAGVTRVVERAFAAGKLIGSVCHGAAGLVSARRPDAQPLVKNQRVNSFTDAEERAVGLEKVVPFLLESRLRELGAKFEGASPWKPFVVHDGQLICGQNPQSSQLVAQTLLQAMQAAASEIVYRAGDRTHIATLVPAAGSATRAAVVLLPDWRGQSPLAREHANRLASLGCDVAIADLYGNGFNPDSPDQVGPMVQQLLANRSGGIAALGACVDALRAKVASGTPVFCLGFSAGAVTALDYGRSGANVAGIIVCSALLKPAAIGMDTCIGAPVLVLQGTQDQVSPMEVVNAVIAEMDAAGNDVQFLLFGQTHHAFDNRDAGTDPSARLCYSPLATERAWSAIGHFLAEAVTATDTVRRRAEAGGSASASASESCPGPGDHTENVQMWRQLGRPK